LDASISSKELSDTFSQFGNITSCKVQVRENNVNAIGYVNFEHPENAEKAISIVNGKKIGESGNIVYVSKFIPRHERQRHLENVWINIYIKDLPPSIDSDEKLRELFSRFGQTSSCRVMKNLNNNTPLGFGYVCFVHHEDAVSAVDTMNGVEIDGSVIYCARFKTKGERIFDKNRIIESQKRNRIHQYLGRNLYVKHLEENVTEDLLRKEFEAYGNVYSVRIERSESGASKGFGYVCYNTKEEANNAITQCGKNKIIEGCTKPLYVNLHEPKEIRAQRIVSNRPRKNPYAYQNGPVIYGIHPQWGGYGYGGTQRGPPKPQTDPRQGNPQTGGGRVMRNNQQSNAPPRAPKYMNDTERHNQGNAIFSKLKMLVPNEDDNVLANFISAVMYSKDFTYDMAEKFITDDKFLLASLGQFQGVMAQQQNFREGDDKKK